MLVVGLINLKVGNHRILPLVMPFEENPSEVTLAFQSKSDDHNYIVKRGKILANHMCP